MSRYIKIIVLLVCFASVFVWASAQLTMFHAFKQNNVVYLEWTTASENNLKAFEIQRSTDQQNWQKIATKTAFGNSSGEKYYSHEDNDLPKAAETSYYYRLAMVDHSGLKTYSSVISVTGKSGMRHTWGSIKAMFR